MCSAGGVTLLAMDGKITIVNTLESRLELLAAQVRGKKDLTSWDYSVVLLAAVQCQISHG